jgi:hypothetical protein
MNQPRCHHTATLLSTGNVLVAGGFTSCESDTTSAELYNPTTGEWQTTGSLHAARQNGAAILLANGQVLLAGGINFNNGTESILTAAELYNPSSGVWSVTGNMISGIVNPASTLLGNHDVDRQRRSTLQPGECVLD